MVNENETLTTPADDDFSKILAILDTSAGDRLKESVLKRLYPAFFGDRTEGRPGVAQEAFAAVALARESPIYSPTEVKVGPVAPARPTTFPNPKATPTVAAVVNSTQRGYSPGENIRVSVHTPDPKKEEEVMRGIRFEDDPLVAAKDKALAAKPQPAPAPKPAPKTVDEEAEGVEHNGQDYLTVAAVARRCGNIHPRAVAHRCEKLGFRCVKNPKGTGSMIIKQDALEVIDSFHA